MKANRKLRSLKDNSNAVVHIPRLIALTIPFIFITFLHIANLFTPMPEWLMEPVIQIAILFSGCVIAVLGLQFGLMPLMALLLVLWGITIYYYAQFVANWF